MHLEEVSPAPIHVDDFAVECHKIVDYGQYIDSEAVVDAVAG